MQNLFSRFEGWFAEVKNFFARDPLTAAVLIFVIIVYGALFVTHHEHAPKPTSKAMQQIMEAEKKMKSKEDSNELKEFILEKAGPVELFLLIIVPVILFAALVIGMFLDAYSFSQLAQKREIITPIGGGALAVPWGIREIIKSVIWVMFAGIMVSLSLGVIQGLIFGRSQEYENIFLLLHTVLLDAFIFFFILYLVIRQMGGNLAELGLRISRWGQEIWLGVKGYVAALPLVILVILALVLICDFFHYEPPPHPLVEVFVEEDYKHPWVIYFSIFLACTLGPVVEELFFRGFCYSAFKKQWGVKWAMILSAAFFALIHNSIFAFLPIFILGLIFAYVYEKRGSLVPTIIMHVLHNSIFIGYFFILKRSVLDHLSGG